MKGEEREMTGKEKGEEVEDGESKKEERNA